MFGEIAPRLSTAMPIGSIMMWALPLSQIPHGWYLCDGRVTPSGLVTPNLQGVLVIGANGGVNPPNSSGFGAFTLQQVAGSTSHYHSVYTGPGYPYGGGGSVYTYAQVQTVNTSSVSLLPTVMPLYFIMRG